MELNLKDLLKILNAGNSVESRGLDNPIKVTPVVEEKKDPVKPKRCQHDGCSVKLMLADFACKCKGFYCSQHRFSIAHNCSFDYKGATKETLTKQMPAVSAQKMERI